MARGSSVTTSPFCTCRLVQQHRTDLTGKWADLAKDAFPERIPKQLRERWIFELAPEIKKGMWTPEEEELLIARHKLVQNKWAEIAKVRQLCLAEQLTAHALK